MQCMFTHACSTTKSASQLPEPEGHHQRAGRNACSTTYAWRSRLRSFAQATAPTASAAVERLQSAGGREAPANGLPQQQPFQSVHSLTDNLRGNVQTIPSSFTALHAPVSPQTADAKAALTTLKALAQWRPTGLSDGPSSLAKVRPYNKQEIQHAIDHGHSMLPQFTLDKLANIAAALAAADHKDTVFMAALANAAVCNMQQHTLEPQQCWASLCYLAAAYARLGLQNATLFTHIAQKGMCLVNHKMWYAIGTLVTTSASPCPDCTSFSRWAQRC